MQKFLIPSSAPSPYDNLQDAVLQFYGAKHHPPPETDRTARVSFPPNLTPSASWSVQITCLLTTSGYQGDGEHDSVGIDLLTERHDAPDCPGRFATTVEPADPPAEVDQPFATSVEARNIADTTEPTSALVSHAIRRLSTQSRPLLECLKRQPEFDRSAWENFIRHF
ncbi:hypothetical protein HPB52_012382 [Rhipicephalus sanguineus]|uniref:Uncharacterized protein n=1 Tax=Rhipicephalus sanguineus TaxID=34632 RepID=A0A9D4T9U2_RHISA|nr:hypothetical protein HPB52_012382 [Rhipicephalus sanguineus]